MDMYFCFGCEYVKSTSLQPSTEIAGHTIVSTITVKKKQKFLQRLLVVLNLTTKVR